MKAGDVVRLIRPKHWLKNILVLFPLAFSGMLASPSHLLHGLLAFISFSLMASAVYMLNDFRDIASDRAHPSKRDRPLASGAVSPVFSNALALAFACASVAIVVFSASRMPASLAFLAGYGAVNLAYSFGLKKIPVIDVALLASGFALRVFFGGAFLAIDVSFWLLLCVLALSFFFGLGKRRGELDEVGPATRDVLKGYTRDFLDRNMYVFLACGLVFYSLWTYYRFVAGTAAGFASLLQVTLCVGLALLACMRYSYDIESSSSDGDPVNVVLSDRLLLVIALLWLALMVLFIYAC